MSVKCLLLCVEKPHQNYQDQPHQIMRGIVHLYSMWKIQKFQCMWKVHLISTFFSESVSSVTYSLATELYSRAIEIWSCHTHYAISRPLDYGLAICIMLLVRDVYLLLQHMQFTNAITIYMIVWSCSITLLLCIYIEREYSRPDHEMRTTSHPGNISMQNHVHR